ncbi:MAG TPA: TrbG/VirB9 family P-type conjugative transfer protein, partial [Candidatus Binataceae bacterium]|nr:TrbG/VirB9 family P-type conjugative transfer protein [Candidatus Binataceae bacterium]
SLASLDPGALNFSYAVSGPKLPWKPVRAFDDGTHIYIQMPATTKSSEAPALLVAAGDGSEMVNYRVRGDYYVVDKLFDQAVLFRASVASRTASASDTPARRGESWPRHRQLDRPARAFTNRAEAAHD